MNHQLIELLTTNIELTNLKEIASLYMIPLITTLILILFKEIGLCFLAKRRECGKGSLLAFIPVFGETLLTGKLSYKLNLAITTISIQAMAVSSTIITYIMLRAGDKKMQLNPLGFYIIITVLISVFALCTLISFIMQAVLSYCLYAQYFNTPIIPLIISLVLGNIGSGILYFIMALKTNKDGTFVMKNNGEDLDIGEIEKRFEQEHKENYKRKYQKLNLEGQEREKNKKRKKNISEEEIIKEVTKKVLEEYKK